MHYFEGAQPTYKKSFNKTLREKLVVHVAPGFLSCAHRCHLNRDVHHKVGFGQWNQLFIGHSRAKVQVVSTRSGGNAKRLNKRKSK
jgi:hypothetical protein